MILMIIRGGICGQRRARIGLFSSCLPEGSMFMSSQRQRVHVFSEGSVFMSSQRAACFVRPLKCPSSILIYELAIICA